jgi:hypothetical protein
MCDFSKFASAFITTAPFFPPVNPNNYAEDTFEANHGPERQGKLLPFAPRPGPRVNLSAGITRETPATYSVRVQYARPAINIDGVRGFGPLQAGASAFDLAELILDTTTDAVKRYIVNIKVVAHVENKPEVVLATYIVAALTPGGEWTWNDHGVAVNEGWQDLLDTFEDLRATFGQVASFNAEPRETPPAPAPLPAPLSGCRGAGAGKSEALVKNSQDDDDIVF